MSNIKQQVVEAYKQLPEGYKRRASEIYGSTRAYFSSIIRGEVKDIDTYYSAFYAIKQAGSEALKNVTENVERINAIKVNPNKVA